jgi:hypothetical protein
MAKRNKFEEMLERLVNEDRTGAEELFHEIVVERSREIYENLLAEEEDDEDIDEATDEEVDESEEELDESDDEELDESDDEDLDESDDDDLDEGFFGEADPTDDLMGDVASDMDTGMDMGGDEMGGDMGMDDMGMGDEGGDTESRIADLEDELEALKAEFEALMSDEDGEEGDDMDIDMDVDAGDDEEGDDMDMDDAGDEEGEEEMPFKAESKRQKSQSEIMREYTDKVGGERYDAFGKMGDNGANTKSPMAKPNNMGGTTANIAKSGTEAGVEANKGNLKGSALNAQNPKDMNTKNVNVPGAKGATKMSNQPGHGAEKKGKPETADKGASSMLNGAPKRAK